MTSITERRRKVGKLSYRFTILLEQDAQGKQIRQYKTWTPPDGLTPSKAKRKAEREAAKWEAEIKAELEGQPPAPAPFPLMAPSYHAKRKRERFDCQAKRLVVL